MENKEIIHNIERKIKMFCFK